MPIEIDYNKCNYKDGKYVCEPCHIAGDGCVEVCPTGALERKLMVELTADDCVDCAACEPACPYEAITLK